MFKPNFLIVLSATLVLAAAGQTAASEPESSQGQSDALRFPSEVFKVAARVPTSPAAWEHVAPELDPGYDPSDSPSDLRSTTTDVMGSSGSPTYRIVPKANNPAPSPYKGVYYDNDFSYLDNPRNNNYYLGDFTKQQHVGGFTYSVGGEYRIRQEDRQILGLFSNVMLQRTRLFANVSYNGWLRAYAEAIDATSAWEDSAPLFVDENRFDALNLFGDVRLLAGHHGDLWFRAGRQELLYGDERLVSPLDWANTRRTFDGFKLLWKGTNWDADFFWTKPVPLGQHVSNDHNFDSPDESQEFLGLWLSRKGCKHRKLDMFYLRYVEYDAPTTFEYNTFGGRYEGNSGNWLWDLAGGYQFGAVGPLPQSAGFYTIGGGHKLPNLPWSPVLWVYFDWASGDRDPGDGINQTFNQMFPLGHKYLGFMDFVGRQNIEDWNTLVKVSPCEKIDLLAWFHVFKLQQAADALYNAGGGAFAFPVDGQDVGQELDFLVKYKIRPRADLVVGYSHLFAGGFLLNALGPGLGKDFVYTQFSLRF